MLKPDELEITDLVFVDPPEDQPSHFEYLLQLHVAVANVGNRKGILTRIRLDRFVDADGREIMLPLGADVVQRIVEDHV